MVQDGSEGSEVRFVREDCFTLCIGNNNNKSETAKSELVKIFIRYLTVLFLSDAYVIDISVLDVSLVRWLEFEVFFLGSPYLPSSCRVRHPQSVLRVGDRRHCLWVRGLVSRSLEGVGLGMQLVFRCVPSPILPRGRSICW